MKAIVGSLLLAAAVVGCATPPKPRELEAYDSLKRSSPISDAAKRSPDLVSTADRLGEKARDEWQSNDLDESRRDALMADIKLKTALALTEQEKSKARVQQVSAEQGAAEEEYASLAKDLAAATEQVNLMIKLGEARKSADADRQRLSEQMTTEQQKAQAEQQKLALQLATEQKVASAQLALRTADTVDAGKYAKAEYQTAAEMFSKAQLEVKNGNLLGAQASAEVAKNNADRATEISKPQYEQAEQVSQNKMRDESLEHDATAISAAQVRRERRGNLQRLVIALQDLFSKRQTSITAGKDGSLDAVAALINKYPTYPVQVMGHTDNRGKSGELIALSAARAQAVFSALVSRGVEAKRLLVSGQGGDDPIADNRTAAGRAKNNRIEVIFLYH
ncbi:MAG TPA: OmpA family protein [Polyangia bacterium]|jgi:outer membrane protein OmpA-like peptidoglycan-associated protein|nr:OmpA family protein [Polyangia bacterium]